MSLKKALIFLVDDDALFLKSLEIEFLLDDEFLVKTFATGELCINHLFINPEIIILDYHLDDIDKTAMNGIQTLDEINKVNSGISVVMLSAQDKINVAIDCMHHGATDYVVKSETTFIRLKTIIKTINERKKLEREVNWYMERL